jgi:regulatory protein
VNARGRSARRSKSAQRSAQSDDRAPLTRQKLEQLALAYLNRFDVSESKLQKYLATKVHQGAANADAEIWIAELIARYRASGLLDDARFARHTTEQLTARGKSSRAIAQKLAAKGVPSEIAEELLIARRHDDPGVELAAARTYVRKRRLGPYRSPDQRGLYRQKDLAALARQGFSFDIARQALGPGPSTDDEFYGVQTAAPFSLPNGLAHFRVHTFCNHARQIASAVASPIGSRQVRVDEHGSAAGIRAARRILSRTRLRFGAASREAGGRALRLAASHDPRTLRWHDWER